MCVCVCVCVCVIFEQYHGKMNGKIGKIVLITIKID